jgi:hypothetical protein
VDDRWLPNSQTWLGLAEAEPIDSSVPDGSGLGEIVHDEPFQLPVVLAPDTQTSVGERAITLWKSGVPVGSVVLVQEVPL